ncbi:MAG TPA: hypothetical protein VKC60_13190 [Opitutaceae bacterium]|nr:hypothetical protein [Opitutaceae bacterium]
MKIYDQINVKLGNTQIIQHLAPLEISDSINERRCHNDIWDEFTDLHASIT